MISVLPSASAIDVVAPASGGFDEARRASGYAALPLADDASYAQV